jgi:CheY-like chemotaxis protein
MANEEKRILAVDDDDAIRMLVLTILRRRGFTVDTAKNGAEALERLERCTYVVMLLDLMMPVVSGWEVLDYLSRMDAAKRPLTIVLTAGGEPRDFNPDLVMGSIHKPFDVDLLVDTVTACVAAVSARAQLPGCPPSDSDTKPAGPLRPKAG